MKYIFLLILLSCASRFENFDTVHPGMTKTDLREEMTLVQGILNFPPYEFRSYPQGLIVLKDNVVVDSFKNNSELTLDVECTTKASGSHASYRYYIRSAVGLDTFEKALFANAKQKLTLLLRLRGFTVVDEEIKSKAVIIMEFATRAEASDSYNHRFSMSAVTPEKGSIWRVNAETKSNVKELSSLIPSLMAAATDYIQIPLRDPKELEIRYTDVSNRIMRNAEPIELILSKDKTLGETFMKSETLPQK